MGLYKLVCNWPLFQGCRNGKQCLCSLPETGGFDKKCEDEDLAFYSQDSRTSLLLRRVRPWKSTKMVGVTHAKAPFTKRTILAAPTVRDDEVGPLLTISVSNPFWSLPLWGSHQTAFCPGAFRYPQWTPEVSLGLSLRCLDSLHDLQIAILEQHGKDSASPTTRVLAPPPTKKCLKPCRIWKSVVLSLWSFPVGKGPQKSVESGFLRCRSYDKTRFKTPRERSPLRLKSMTSSCKLGNWHHCDFTICFRNF